MPLSPIYYNISAEQVVGVTFEYNGNGNPIDVSQLSRGNYLVKITTEEQQSVKKLIVE